MIRILLPAALAALLVAPLGAAGAAPAGAPVRPDRRFALDLRAATYGGGFDGFGVRRESGGVAIVEASAHPELRGDSWQLDVPFRVSHRETFGADLSETKGSLDVEPSYVRSKALRLGLIGGVSGANRPNWPDLYQRTDAGVLPPTDRYSYFAWRAGAQLYARPAARQHLRARYRYVDYDFVEDTNFEPDPAIGDVMHLTPRDRVEHQVDTSWRYREQSWHFGVTLDYTRREYGTLLARNRRSGDTPEAGGVELNPKQKLNIWEPAGELGFLAMDGKLDVSLQYGLDVWDDPFQGYYSLTAHNPRVKARLAVTKKLGAEVTLEGWYATFSADGSTRLEPGSGSRRTDSRTSAEGELAYQLGGGLALQAKVEWAMRSTNYRDYVPTPLPPPSPPGLSSGFDVDFDYTNVAVLAGIRYEM